MLVLMLVYFSLFGSVFGVVSFAPISIGVTTFSCSTALSILLLGLGIFINLLNFLTVNPAVVWNSEVYYVLDVLIE